MTTTKNKSTKLTKKQQQEEFCLFLDSIILNVPDDVTTNEIWMPNNLYNLLKKKSHNGFKLFKSDALKDNQIILGNFFADEQIN